MPDPQRPSAAPLSESEADRLSERFTASWDDPELEALPPPDSVAPAPAPDAAATKPKPKPTLHGIAPIVVGPAPPPGAPPAPLPAPRKVTGLPAGTLVQPPAVTPEVPTPQAAPPAAQAPGTSEPAAVEVAAAMEPSIPPPPPSAPDSSVARGLTTPSKPYIPKDDPSTPAVVISDAALRPSVPSPDRTRITQTLPGQTRSSPVAAPIPLAPAPVASSSLDDDEPLPELRGNRRKGPLLVAAVFLLAGAAFVALKPGHDARQTESPSSIKDSSVRTAVAPAAPLPSPVAETASPEAEPVRSAAPAPRVTTAQTPDRPRTNVAPRAESAPAKPSAKKTTSSSTSRKSKAETKSTPTEPGTSKPKGVIVRETPF